MEKATGRIIRVRHGNQNPFFFVRAIGPRKMIVVGSMSAHEQSILKEIVGKRCRIDGVCYGDLLVVQKETIQEVK